MRMFAGKSGMIGDTVSALPIAVYLKKRFPQSHLIWPIGKKFSQGAPLYLNHPAIDEIYILDGDEQVVSEKDIAKFNSCQIRLNPTPPHPDNI